MLVYWRVRTPPWRNELSEPTIDFRGYVSFREGVGSFTILGLGLCLVTFSKTNIAPEELPKLNRRRWSSSPIHVFRGLSC